MLRSDSKSVAESKTLLENYYSSVITPYQNIDDFSNEELLQYSIAILKKQKIFRTPKEIELLKKCTESLKFFKEVIQTMGEATHTELCQNLEFDFFDKDSIVFEAGSFGTTYYVVLKGKVDVFLKVKAPIQEGETETKYEFIKVNTCEAGAGFGELAIMDEHLKPRTATIITTEDTYFATLDRKVYMGTLGRFRKKEIETTVKFLADVPVLAPWSGFNLRSWIYMFDRKEIFKRGQILFLEDGPSEFIYLIKTGEVKLQKKIVLNLDENKSETSFFDEKKRVNLIDKKPIEKTFDFAVLGAGQILGDEEGWQHYKIIKERDKNKERKKLRKFLFVQDQDDKNEDPELLLAQNLAPKAHGDAHVEKTENHEPTQDTQNPETKHTEPAQNVQQSQQVQSTQVQQKQVDTKKSEPGVQQKQMPKRIYTAIVESLEAEIWYANKKNFFAKLENSLQSLKILVKNIEIQRQWREEHIRLIQKTLAERVSQLPKKALPKPNEDLPVMIKHKQTVKRIDEEHKARAQQSFNEQMSIASNSRTDISTFQLNEGTSRSYISNRDLLTSPARSRATSIRKKSHDSPTNSQTYADLNSPLRFRRKFSYGESTGEVPILEEETGSPSTRRPSTILEVEKLVTPMRVRPNTSFKRRSSRLSSLEATPKNEDTKSKVSLMSTDRSRSHSIAFSRTFHDMLEETLDKQSRKRISSQVEINLYEGIPKDLRRLLRQRRIKILAEHDLPKISGYATRHASPVKAVPFSDPGKSRSITPAIRNVSSFEVQTAKKLGHYLPTYLSSEPEVQTFNTVTKASSHVPIAQNLSSLPSGFSSIPGEELKRPIRSKLFDYNVGVMGRHRRKLMLETTSSQAEKYAQKEKRKEAKAKEKLLEKRKTVFGAVHRPEI